MARPVMMVYTVRMAISAAAGHAVEAQPVTVREQGISATTGYAMMVLISAWPSP